MSGEIRAGMMRYCVVGNVVKQHTHTDGTVRFGTAAFPGGRRVYISRRLWGDAVTVMGLNRYKSRYALERIPLAYVENIRPAKTFHLKVLELMRDDPEYKDMWWGHRKADRQGAAEYAQLLNRVKAGDREAAERYDREIMRRFRRPRP